MLYCLLREYKGYFAVLFSHYHHFYKNAHPYYTMPQIQSLMIGLIKALLIPLLELIQCCSASPRELSLRQSFQSLDGGLFPKIGYPLTKDIRWNSFLNIRIGLMVVTLVDFYPP
jgi:hypothetical protein